jgi:hypothetical protein
MGFLPVIRQGSSSMSDRDDYNRYYISPSLRYKRKASNPRESPENYEDETYIYRNLHNDKFWNWVHPLAYERIKAAPKDLDAKISVPVL